jgi:hypothetical protein
MVFLDWLTVAQDHPGGVPVVNDGLVVSLDSEGEVEWQSPRHTAVEGSYSTSVRVRSDGVRVWLSGNVGRFGRRDNLFGYDLDGTMGAANRILGLVGLPPFTRGERVRQAEAYAWTGARFSRLDLTCNYATGGMVGADRFMRALSAQKRSRVNQGVYEGESVVFGRGSKHFSETWYIKHKELLRHSKPGGVGPGDRVLGLTWNSGIVRHELRLFSRFLLRHGIRYWGDVNMGQLIQLYDDRNEMLDRLVSASPDGWSDLPPRLEVIARAWKDGADMRSVLPRSTFYRYRRALLVYGIDISVPASAVVLRGQFTRVERVQVTAVAVPDWYWSESA